MVSSPVMTESTHPGVVRLTHWINVAAFGALLVSGFAILLAHPRLYWGETGAFGSPALLDLPLPLNMDQSGWGRSLHFLAAWGLTINGALYVLSGLARRHFTTGMPVTYGSLQRLTYLGVVFILFPVMILTGLAMSPAVMSAAPIVVAAFGGHQSARTIHFFTTNLLVVFLVIHVLMIWLAGFRTKMRAMIIGGMAKENA